MSARPDGVAVAGVLMMAATFFVYAETDLHRLQGSLWIFIVAIVFTATFTILGALRMHSRK